MKGFLFVVAFGVIGVVAALVDSGLERLDFDRASLAARGLTAGVLESGTGYSPSGDFAGTAPPAKPQSPARLPEGNARLRAR